MSQKQDKQIVKLAVLLSNIRRSIHAIPTKQMACKDVTFAQMRVIRFLEERAQSPMKDIARALGVTLPTATGLVENLVHNGYLKRHQIAKDRRLVYVALAHKSHKLINTFAKVQQAWCTEIRNSMTRTSWAKFIKALETIDALFKRRGDYNVI